MANHPKPAPAVTVHKESATARRALRVAKTLGEQLRRITTLTTPDEILVMLHEGKGLVNPLNCRRHRIPCFLLIKPDKSLVLSCPQCVSEVAAEVMGRQVR